MMKRANETAIHSQELQQTVRRLRRQVDAARAEIARLREQAAENEGNNMPLYMSTGLAEAAEDVLGSLLENAPASLFSDVYPDRGEIERVETFAAAGVPSDSPGVVIMLVDGSQVHLTITAYTPTDETL